MAHLWLDDESGGTGGQSARGGWAVMPLDADALVMHVALRISDSTAAGGLT